MARHEARKPVHVRCLEEADRPAALLGEAVHLCRSQLGIPVRHHAQGDEAAGVGGAPLVDGPVVVRLHHDERDVLVLALVEGAGAEAGHGREVQRGEHAVGVHVAHTLVHVEAPRTQLGVGPGVEAPLLTRPADRRRHAEGRRGGRALEVPLVDAVVVADHLGRLVAPLGGHVALEQVRWLDHVVVDADQDHVVHLHGLPPLTGAQNPPGAPVSMLVGQYFRAALRPSRWDVGTGARTRPGARSQDAQERNVCSNRRR